MLIVAIDPWIEIQLSDDAEAMEKILSVVVH